MDNRIIAAVIPVVVCLLQLQACTEFLDAKPDQKLVIPEKIQDLQGILDYYARVNNYQPAAAEISADDYYLTAADWLAITRDTDRRMYVWEKEKLWEPGYDDWAYIYDNLYRANTVLDNLNKLTVADSERIDLDNLKGQALVLRARGFMEAASIWALAYDEASADSDPGIPLRLSSDFNLPSVRATVRQTYDQIIQDLKSAVPLLLPEQIHVMRAGRTAAYGYLARAFLFMRNYGEAGLYADSCLQLHPSLLDYNLLNSAATYPVRQFNEEVIFSSRMLIPSFLANTRAKIDSMLYQSYAQDDLRKKVFFRDNNNGTYGFKGSYDGSAYPFDGIAADEMYLIRAECNARSGGIDQAMADLNALVEKRWDRASFVALSAATQQEALDLILKERRKELLMRGLRWMDVKRLNREGANISLRRKLNGQEYILPANDLRFALPIPDDVIALSGMQQNPR